MDPVEFQHKVDIPGRSEAEQAAFFDRVLECALAAQARAGTIHCDIALFETRVRLVFAGTALNDVMVPALAHLDISDLPGEPDAVVHVWDSASTGVAIPPPPVPREWLTDRGDIWGMSSERYKSAFHWIECSVNLFDRQAAVGVYWVSTVAGLPYWTVASPFRTLLHWWLEQHRGQLLHAAAVGGPDGAVLITGKGGVGKSSTALSCLEAGMAYVADDYLAVRLDPEPVVHSLYSTAKLDADQVARFPALQELVTNQRLLHEEKGVLALFPRFEKGLARSLPLKVIATPVFGTGLETTTHVTSADTLRRAAAFTTMSQLPHAGRRTHEFIDRRVATVPGVELRLGRDLHRVPEAIQTLLAGPIPARPIDDGGQEPSEPLPLVTVIIPVHNGGRFLPEAIANILSQGYPALELIVVDDGSTEDTEAVVLEQPVDIRFFRQENAGPAAARNRGIRDASGELIAFLDVDDLWPAGTLPSLVDRVRSSPDLDAVHGRGQPTRYSPGELPGEYIGSAKEAFPYYIGAGVYRRRVFQSVGLFDTTLRFGEDHDWFLRATECGARVLELDEVTLFVRRHQGNMTRGKSLVELNALRVFKKMLDRRRVEATEGGS